MGDGGGAGGFLSVERFAEARAPELESLFAALQGSGTSISDNKVEAANGVKRRTRSHNRYKRRFWKQQRAGDGNGGGAAKENDGNASAANNEDARKRVREPRKLSRIVRRRVELQDVVKGRGSLLCKDGTRRLVTHVWHAKRFYMTKRWGHWLAAGVTGRGRRARTVLEWSRSDAVLHDAGYYGIIQLEGSQADLAQVLSLVLEPVDDPTTAFSGLPCYVTAMAHRCGKVPLAFIAPVKVIFFSVRGKLWIHVHAAAFDDVFESLQAASQGLSSVSCRSRRGDLATLEIFGEKTVQLLDKAMFKEKKSTSDAARSFEEVLRALPRQACLEMEVDDPRNDGARSLDSESILKDLCVEESVKEGSQFPFSATYWDAVMERLPNVEDSKVSPLWGPVSAAEPPPSEKTVNRWQHCRRMSHFRLDNKVVEPAPWIKCPILLLKHEHKDLTGCSLVLPLSWVHTFWMSLVLSGARVIGQAERHWIMTHACISTFPHDFPDCQSFKELSNHERVDDEAREKTIGTDLEENCFVPRSALVLSAYLRVHGLDSSQFPETDKAVSWTMPAAKGYMRVFLQAARKGVPEDGCGLYAPALEDFRAWLDGEQKWQGVETDNKDASEIRDRIGFVTSAAPWRSGDPAIGFCDGLQLSKLQTWQQAENNESSAKACSGLLVLFHNPRSSKLRPALISCTASDQFRASNTTGR